MEGLVGKCYLLEMKNVMLCFVKGLNIDIPSSYVTPYYVSQM